MACRHAAEPRTQLESKSSVPFAAAAVVTGCETPVRPAAAIAAADADARTAVRTTPGRRPSAAACNGNNLAANKARTVPCALNTLSNGLVECASNVAANPGKSAIEIGSSIFPSAYAGHHSLFQGSGHRSFSFADHFTNGFAAQCFAEQASLFQQQRYLEANGFSFGTSAQNGHSLSSSANLPNLQAGFNPLAFGGNPTFSNDCNTVSSGPSGGSSASGSQQSTQPGQAPVKRTRRRVATMAQRKAANIRERRRMCHLNSAFDRLRKKVPTFAYEKRLSRIETLRLAIMYIQFMNDLLCEDDKESSQGMPTASPSISGSHNGVEFPIARMPLSHSQTNIGQMSNIESSRWYSPADALYSLQ